MKRVRVVSVVAVVAVAGVAAVWVGVGSRGGRAGVGDGESARPADGRDDGWLAPAERVALEVRPTAETLPAVLDRSAERVERLIADLPLARSIPGDRRAGFVALFRERLAMLLDPDFERWLAHIKKYGGRATGPGGRETGFAAITYDRAKPAPGFEGRWAAAAASTRLTPMSIEGMSVRPRRVNGVDVPQPRGATRLFRSVYTGTYHDDADGGLSEGEPSPRFTDIYEVLIPILVQQTRALGGASDDDIRDFHAHLGVWLAWDSSRSRWIPYDQVGYDSGAETGGVIAPPF